MKQIKLTKGEVAIVDDEDFEMLSKYTWYFNRYAYTTINGYNLSMSRVLLGLKKGDKMESDHINHNRLDNRRFNIRIATRSQNNANRRFKGYSWCKENKKWRAMMNIDGKRCHLGYFEDKESAIKAHDDKNKELYGEFALVRSMK